MAARALKSSASQPRWAGSVEGFDGPLLYGWCLDTERPDSRVVLEICVDGEPIGSVIADVARPDLQKTFGGLARAPADVCHGFVADLGTLTGMVQARVANTSHELGKAGRSDEQPPPSPASNHVYSDGGLRLHGWVRHTHGNVSAYLGSRKVAQALPNALVGAPGPDSERLSFTLDLPPGLADGKLHVVRIVDAHGKPLHGSPLTVCCYAQGGKALLENGDRRLLASVIDQYERFVARSLSVGYYEEWKRAFEPAMPKGGAGRTGRTPARCGAIITHATHAGASAVNATRESLRRQAGVQMAIEVHDGGDPAPLLARLARQGCEYVACVRAGDEILPRAFASCVEGFANADTQAVYTDSEHRGKPWFKPAWNLEYASATDCALELLVMRTGAAQQACQGAGELEALCWRVLAKAHAGGESGVAHIPHVLYVWNSTPAPDELERRRRAADDAIRILEPATTLEVSGFLSPDALFRPRRLLRRLSQAERNTRVTLIIPTRDRVELLQRCIQSVQRHTDWPDLEIIVVDNDSAEPATHQYLRSLQREGIRVLPFPGAFNFAAMNNRAAEMARGDIVGLINNDLEALHPGWLDEIVGQLLRCGVGVVGAKLLWPNGMVQHGGVILGMGNGASHFGNRLADGDWGDHGRNQLLQQVSAVTAACLFIRRADYHAVGGMDATAFPVNFNDVDLCLKVRARGQSVMWTPFARLLHAESASRGKEEAPHLRARLSREIENLRSRWGHLLLRDPAYHPSLNLDPHSHPFGGLAIPPRDRSPRLAAWPSAAP